MLFKVFLQERSVTVVAADSVMQTALVEVLL